MLNLVKAVDFIYIVWYNINLKITLNFKEGIVWLSTIPFSVKNC